MNAAGACDCPPCPPGCPPCESPCPCGGGEPVAAPERTRVPAALGTATSPGRADPMRRNVPAAPSMISAEPWWFEGGTIVPGLPIPSLQRRGTRRGRGTFDGSGALVAGSAASAGRSLQPPQAGFPSVGFGPSPDELSEEDRDLARRAEAAKRMQEEQGPSLAKRDLPGGPKEAPASARATQERLRGTERGAGPAAAGTDESLAAARAELADRRYEPYQAGGSRESENAISGFRDRAQERGKDAVVASSRAAADAYAMSVASRTRTAAEAMKAEPQSAVRATGSPAPAERRLSDSQEPQPSPYAIATSPQVFGVEEAAARAAPSEFGEGRGASAYLETLRSADGAGMRGAPDAAPPGTAAHRATLPNRSAIPVRRTADDPIRPGENFPPGPALRPSPIASIAPIPPTADDAGSAEEILGAPATALVAGSASAAPMLGGGSDDDADDDDPRPYDGGRADAERARSLDAAFQERISGNFRAPGKVDPRFGEVLKATHALDAALTSFLATIPADKRLGELVFTRLTKDVAFRALALAWRTALDKATEGRRPAEAAATRRAAIRAFGDRLYALERDRWRKSGRKPPKPKRKDAHARAARLIGDAQSPTDRPPPESCPCPCGPGARDDGAKPDPDEGGDEDDGSTGGRGTFRTFGGALPGGEEVRAIGSWAPNPSSSSGAARPPKTPPFRTTSLPSGPGPYRPPLVAAAATVGLEYRADSTPVLGVHIHLPPLPAPARLSLPPTLPDLRAMLRRLMKAASDARRRLQRLARLLQRLLGLLARLSHGAEGSARRRRGRTLLRSILGQIVVLVKALASAGADLALDRIDEGAASGLYKEAIRDFVVTTAALVAIDYESEVADPVWGAELPEVNAILTELRELVTDLGIVNLDPNQMSWSDLLTAWFLELGTFPGDDVTMTRESVVFHEVERMDPVVQFRQLVRTRLRGVTRSGSGTIEFPKSSGQFSFRTDEFFDSITDGDTARFILGSVYVFGRATYTRTATGVVAEVQITVQNPFSLESFTRLQRGNRGIIPSHERGATDHIALGGNLSQTWTWTERISVE